jgi:hypothetical protein
MLNLLKTKLTKSNFDDLMRAVVKVKPEKKKKSAKRKK